MYPARASLPSLCQAAWLLTTVIAAPVSAQTGGLQIPERPGDERQRFPQIPLEPGPGRPELALPPLPKAPSDRRLSTQLRVEVKKIRLTGNTVFRDVELAVVTAPYEGRTLTSEDLQSLRHALTLYYVNHGYINSGAVIPDQEVKDGVIEIQLVEGRLTEFVVSGNDWLRPSYIEDRVRLENKGALNLQNLQESLQLLQQDRRIGRINAELRPGMRPGESLLRVNVEERRPYELGVSFNNQRSPSVGGLHGEVYGATYNLTGFGDILSVRYGVTGGLDEISTFYSAPLTPRDTRLRLYYDRNDADVVESPFNLIGIRSETESYGISLSHPFYRTPQQQFLAELRFERRQSQTFIFDTEPFPFSPGTEDGKSRITALRFLQEWVDRRPNQVLALRSTLSFGLDVLDANHNDLAGVPDGEFFAWLAQFQWVRRLWDTDNQLLIRSDLQLAANPLLPLEKLAVGGATTVRGYRENVLVRDNGWMASLELRVPVFRLPVPFVSESPEDGQVQLAPFFEFGWSDNVSGVTPDPKTIYSIGLGVRWDPHRNVHSELYWGHALRDVGTGSPETDIQDDGIHFALDVRLF